MYQLLLPAIILIGAAAPATAQVMSNDSKANPSTQGYGTTGAILKDQKSKTRKTVRTDQAPGQSGAETAGARTPHAEDRTTRGTSGPRP